MLGLLTGVPGYCAGGGGDRAARGLRRAVGVLLTAAAALYLMVYFFPPGVHTDAQTDAAMLDETEGSRAALPAPHILFPTKSGSRRAYREKQGEDRYPAAARRLETRVLPGPRAVGAERGVAVESRLDGAAFQTEVYRVDARGIFGLATGSDADVTLSPPLPVLPADARPGTVREWRGFLVSPGGSRRRPQQRRTPALALCRLDGPETVTTPAGTFPGAYRVDLHVRVGDTSRSAPASVSTLWLAPGVGVVRQEVPTAAGRISLEYAGEVARADAGSEP